MVTALDLKDATPYDSTQTTALIKFDTSLMPSSSPISISKSSFLVNHIVLTQNY